MQFQRDGMKPTPALSVRSVWELNTMMFWVHREKMCQRCWLRRYLTNFGSFLYTNRTMTPFQKLFYLKKKEEKKRSLAVYSRSAQKCASRLSTCQVLTVIVRVVRAAGWIARMSACLPGREMQVIFKIKADIFRWCTWHHLHITLLLLVRSFFKSLDWVFCLLPIDELCLHLDLYVSLVYLTHLWYRAPLLLH